MRPFCRGDFQSPFLGSRADRRLKVTATNLALEQFQNPQKDDRADQGNHDLIEVEREGGQTQVQGTAEELLIEEAAQDGADDANDNITQPVFSSQKKPDDEAHDNPHD